MRRILITGPTGFVGARLCARLAELGDVPVGLSRSPDAAGRRVPSLAACLAWSPVAPVPERALDDVHAVVHLAGESVAGRWSDAKKRAIEESRILGTRRIVEAIAARPAGHRPHVLVCASAIGYYGDRGEDEVDERTPAGDDFLAKVCVGWEREAMRAGEHGVRVVCLRIGLVMGLGGGALEPMLPLFRAGLGGKLGSGQQWWPWIHVDDVVGLIRHAIDHVSLSGPMNATAPRPVRQHELASALGQALHRPAFLPAPSFALKAALGEFSSDVLASRRVLPVRATESGYVFRYDEVGAAMRAIAAELKTR